MTESELGKRRKLGLLILCIVIIITGIFAFFKMVILDRYDVYTDDAYVNGNTVQLMAQVTGTVIAINTDDTQLVTQGQVVIQLDPTDTNIALQSAEAKLAETVRQTKQIFENAQSAHASLLLSEADLKKAQLDLDRRKKLVGESAISREEFQHVETDYKAAKARYNVALHNFQSIQALVKNAHLYTHPQVERAKAEFKTAYVNNQRTTIVAPVTGYIAKRSVQIGQQIMPNTPLLAIVPLREIWVDANYKESQLRGLRIGQPVTLEADAYPGETYHGKIFGVGAGTGAAFSLLPAQNATGNWIKIVQRLPVRIALDQKEIQRHPLQIGLSMHVTSHIKDQDGQQLAAPTKSKTLYTTDVYTAQAAKANQLIAKILRDNAPDMQLDIKQSNG